MDLLQNPFYILSASPTDDKRRIMELAEEQSLFRNPDECTEALSVLTSPRKRLSAEVGWLMGVSPQQRKVIFSNLVSNPETLLQHDDIPVLARLNVLCSAIGRLHDKNASSIAPWIQLITATSSAIDTDAILYHINSSRSAAGYTVITDLLAIEQEIEELKRYYVIAVKNALDSLESTELVKAITHVVESITNLGTKQAPVLLSDIVDAYEIEAKNFLEKEENNINILTRDIRRSIKTNLADRVIRAQVGRLIAVAKNWDMVAQPIQVIARSKGTDHDGSHRVAGTIRSLAIDMYNNHNKLELSRQLTEMLQDIFAEVDVISERTAEDSHTLEKIAKQTTQQDLVKPIYSLCEKITENAKKGPYAAEQGANELIKKAPQILRKMKNKNIDIEILSQVKDMIAITIFNCAISYGNEKDDWLRCEYFLNNALKYADSHKVTSKIRENLSTVNNNYRMQQKRKKLLVIKWIFWGGVALFIIIISQQ